MGCTHVHRYFRGHNPKFWCHLSVSSSRNSSVCASMCMRPSIGGGVRGMFENSAAWVNKVSAFGFLVGAESVERIPETTAREQLFVQKKARTVLTEGSVNRQFREIKRNETVFDWVCWIALERGTKFPGSFGDAWGVGCQQERTSLPVVGVQSVIRHNRANTAPTSRLPTCC